VHDGPGDTFLNSQPNRDLLYQLVWFARLLKDRGLRITPGRLIDACRSMKHIDLLKRQDFAEVLKANFVSAKEEIPIFAELFEKFWVLNLDIQPIPKSHPSQNEESQDMKKMNPSASKESWAEEGEEEDVIGKGEYSAQEILAVKDFSQFVGEEEEELTRELTRLLQRIASRESRRRVAAKKGREVDFRRSLRKAVRYGGEILELLWRKRKVKPLNIYVLCDVSGSMDVSTRFILQFLFGLQRIFRKSEIFVFSTRLTRITDIIQRKHWKDALHALGRRVQDWSGGTQIGHCLQIFNRYYTRQLNAKSSAVILISDGWDRGEPEVLQEEMRRLKRKAKRLIWMNPLLGSPDYQPLAQGMRTALPYIDEFLPATNLKGLKAMADQLINLAR
jgi:uncharacterized protein